jgi:hypothetical protein
MEPKISTVTWHSVIRGREFRAIRWLSAPAFITLGAHLQILFVLFLSYVQYLGNKTLDPLISTFLALLQPFIVISPLLILADFVAVLIIINISFNYYKGNARIVVLAISFFEFVLSCIFLVECYMLLSR